MKDWIKKALTKTVQPKGGSESIVIEPNEKLVYAVKFAVAMTLILSTLETAHMIVLN